MFDKAKQFVARKLMERQLKDAPPEQRELVMTMLEKDPQLFEKIAVEMQAEMKKGKNQMAAAMAVFPKYQKELQAIMGDKLKGVQRGPTAGFNPNGTIRK
jgi:uncharacterized protein YneF (UPF0154 family)